MPFFPVCLIAEPNVPSGKIFGHGSVQIATVRSQNLDQPLKPMVVFKLWLNRAYGVQTAWQIHEKRLRFVGNNLLQQL